MENYFIWKFISYGDLFYMDLILFCMNLLLLRMDLILLRMENDAAIYPLHFGNSNFCKSMPPVYYISFC